MEISLYTILVDEVDETQKFYVCVIFDNTRLDIQLKVFTLEELMHELESRPYLKKDFSIDDGIFQCNSMRKAIKVSNQYIQRQRSNQYKAQSFRANSMYQLLTTGVREGFLIIGDGVGDVVTGASDITSFNSIRFSESTMSVYAPMRSDEGFYNKMIVTQGDDGKLVFKPFRFATKTSVVELPNCVKLKTIQINGDEYTLWETNVLSIYDETVPTFDCLINFCNTERNMYLDILRVLNDYKSANLDKGEQEQQWVGGSSDYSSYGGIFFSSSYKRMNNADRHVLIQNVVDGTKVGLDEDQLACILKTELSEMGYSYGAVTAALVLLQLIMRSDDETILANTWSLKKQVKDALFWNDLLLYRVRTRAFLEQKIFAFSDQPILSGGRTSEITYIERRA